MYRALTRAVLILLSVALFTQLPACGGSHRGAVTYTEAAEAAFARAERTMNRRDYDTARMQFRDVQLTYPYSTFAPLAEFNIAEAYFRAGSYLTAVEAWRRFIRLHPTHELVGEATWRVALSFERQMPSGLFFMPPDHERDRNAAHHAVDAYQHFLDRFPDHERAVEAAERKLEVEERLAMHELYVARFYMRRRAHRHPEAALERSAYLLRYYPASSAVPEALFIGARAALMLDDGETALSNLRRLRDEFADTRWGAEAAQYMEEYGL